MTASRSADGRAGVVLGIVLIALGLIPPVHVFAQFVRAGGTPMPGANAVVGAGQLAPGPTS